MIDSHYAYCRFNYQNARWDRCYVRGMKSHQDFDRSLIHLAKHLLHLWKARARQRRQLHHVEEYAMHLARLTLLSRGLKALKVGQ